MAVRMYAYGLADAPPAGCTKASPYLVREVDYTYDHFLNLAKQAKQYLRRDGSTAIQFSGCAPLGATASETYQYDELQRLLGESRTWAGLFPNAADHYAYDDLGNITAKDDYADLYSYGSSARTSGNAGPHAVVSVSQGGAVKATFSYDSNGNMVAGDGRTVEFDSLDRPITVTLAGVTTRFRYAPDGSRYLQRTTGIASSPTTKTVYYVDKAYERIEWPAAYEEKTYIGPSVAIYSRNGGNRDVRYLHLDRLGSTDAVTNAGGFEVIPDAHGFDAFGKPRGRDWQWAGERLHTDTDYDKTTEHGFTGHEHLDDTYLIHMNGRVYDYRLGRFLSVDPIISNPANSQSINPYSYIGNNPLSGVDPTGYMDAPADGGCTQLTGSHICGTVSAGSNLQINGIPVNGGSLNPGKGGSTTSSGGSGNRAGLANASGTGAPATPAGASGARGSGSELPGANPADVESPSNLAARAPVPGTSTAVNDRIFEPTSRVEDGTIVVSGVWHPTLFERYQAMSTAQAITFGFFTGASPRTMRFGPKSAETWVLRTSRGYQSTWQAYQSKLGLSLAMGMDPISARYGVPGGSDNLLTVVMGTYSVRFDPVDASGDVIQVRAFNNSSLTSLGHGWFDGPNELPEVKGYLPLGSIRQDFSWFESMPYNGTRVPTMPSDR